MVLADFLKTVLPIGGPAVLLIVAAYYGREALGVGRKAATWAKASVGFLAVLAVLLWADVFTLNVGALFGLVDAVVTALGELVGVLAG